jgi:hypothetical protein
LHGRILVAVALLLAPALMASLAAAGSGGEFRPAYILVLEPSSGGWVGWPPPGLLALLTTRACPHGFIAVYGVDSRPLIAVVYVEANATDSDMLEALRECGSLVGECYPGTRLKLEIPLAAPVHTVTVQASGAKVYTTVAIAATAARSIVRSTVTATAKTTTTAATSATAPPEIEALPPPATTPAPHGTGTGLGHAKTSTGYREATSWGAGERLAFTLIVAAAVTVAVYLAWRVRG